MSLKAATITIPAREIELQKKPTVLDLIETTTGDSKGRVLINGSKIELVDHNHVYGRFMDWSLFQRIMQQFGKDNTRARRVKRTKRAPRRTARDNSPALIAVATG